MYLGKLLGDTKASECGRNPSHLGAHIISHYQILRHIIRYMVRNSGSSCLHGGHESRIGFHNSIPFQQLYLLDDIVNSFSQALPNVVLLIRSSPENILGRTVCPTVQRIALSTRLTGLLVHSLEVPEEVYAYS